MDSSATSVTDQNHTASPTLECDVIMKGGITSGVIYPGALAEFAKTYRFRGVGGASAGAIGAGFGAAAEFGRAKGGFTRLERVPDQLEDGALGKMFQPTSRTRVLFDLLTDATAKDGDGLSLPVSRRVLRAAAHLAGGFWLASAIWLVFAAAWIWISALWGGTLTPLLFVSGVVIAVILWVVTLVVLTVKRLTKDVPANSFGVCTGLQQSGSKHPGFTDWLSDTVDDLAGFAPRTTPLTFADLERGGDPDDPDLDRRPISLKMITTCLSYGRPYEMPIRSYEYFYDPQEWKALFPQYVMDYLNGDQPDPEWMRGQRLDDWKWETKLAAAAVAPPTAGARRWRHTAEEARRADDFDVTAVAELDVAAEIDGLRPRTPHPSLARLAGADRLPVIVAMRMSMSFPGLISAIPLWVVRFNSRRTRLAQKAYAAGDTALAEKIGLDFEKLWFSDGGLCSNFPIHLFDAPLPSRPTFAINLDRFTDDTQRNPREDAEFWPSPEDSPSKRPWVNYVYARTNSDELFPTYREIPDTGLSAAVRFGTSMFNTSRNWQDNSYLAAPGYRDRIVRVRQTGAEGGLNLNMPTHVIKGLVERGRYAARALTTQFTTPTFSNKAGEFTGWDNHRWYRYRSLVATLPTFMEGFARGHDAMADIDPAQPPSQPVSARARAFDGAINGAFHGLAAQIEPDDEDGIVLSREISNHPRNSGTLRRAVQL